MTNENDLDRILQMVEALPSNVLDEMSRIASHIMSQRTNPVPPDIEKAIHLQMFVAKEVGASMESVIGTAIVTSWVGGYLRGLRAAESRLDRLEEVTSKMFNGGDLPKA